MFEVMITLFVIVVVGYAAGKLGYMGGDFDRKLSSLVINWTCPALILSSSMTGDLPDRQYILPLLGISVLTYVVLTALAWGFSRLLTKRIEHRGILSFAMVFGNVGFMGYPVVASIFGHQAVFYAAVLNVVNTFAVFTIGTMMITGGEGSGRERFNKKVLYSTPMLSAYLSMLIVALGIDNDTAYNINADTAAAELAISLGAEKLILLTDVRGVLRDPKDESTLIPQIRLHEVPGLMASGVIGGGMIPKIQCCVDAVEQGVRRTHILDGRIPHSILTEMLSHKGVGTMLWE